MNTACQRLGHNFADGVCTDCGERRHVPRAKTRLERTHDVLRAAGGRILRTLPDRGHIVLTFWQVPKGVIIVQALESADPQDPDIATYADWPTGHTFADLEALLKS